MRCVAVLDGTLENAAEQAGALAGFLVRGIVGDAVGETIAFYDDTTDTDRLVGIAPTTDVRLVKTVVHRPEPMVAALTEATTCGDISLFVWPAGDLVVEVAARVACRARGTLLTNVLTAVKAPDRLECRKNVYSAHMVGSFALTTRPWCVTLDRSWVGAAQAGPPDHRVVSDIDLTAETSASPISEIEFVRRPATNTLAESRFLVAVGRGVGSSSGVERVAQAARRMGAAFGVTRGVVMNGWASADLLVGVSGARTAPAVCVVVGASGAPAFHWGIEKADWIAAVNPDERAPAVGNADVVILDDGVSVMEELAAVAESDRPAL